MRRKRPVESLLLPHGVRALVPVFAVAGGTGRSTVAGLIAQVLAATTRTVVVDPAPRAASPWGRWIGVDAAPPGHGGLPGLVARPDASACLRAVVSRPVPLSRRGRKDLRDRDPSGSGGPAYDLLTDTRPLTAPPVQVPEEPRWYADLMESGGWFAGIVDTGTPVPAAHIRSRHAGWPSTLDLWWRRTDAVPVILAPTSADGLAALRQLLALLEYDGLAPARAVVGLVDLSGPDTPRRLRREIGDVTAREGTTVRFPYDDAIRSRGLGELDEVSDGVLDAARAIARAVADAVRAQAPEDADPPAGPPGGEPEPDPDARPTDPAPPADPAQSAGADTTPPVRPAPRTESSWVGSDPPPGRVHALRATRG